MTTSEVRRLFDRGTSAFNAHDMKAFAETMAEDVSVRAPGMGELKGKQAVTAFYRGWIDAFPDARVDMTAIHILDDVAIEQGVFVGTQRAVLHTPNGDLPATGRSVRIEYTQVVRYRGDKVASFDLSYDRMELLEQLGLSPSAERDTSAGWQAEVGAQAQPH